MVCLDWGCTFHFKETLRSPTCCTFSLDSEVAALAQSTVGWTSLRKHVINKIVYGLKPLDTINAPTQVTLLWLIRHLPSAAWECADLFWLSWKLCFSCYGGTYFTFMIPWRVDKAPQPGLSKAPPNLRPIDWKHLWVKVPVGSSEAEQMHLIRHMSKCKQNKRCLD